MNTPNDDLIEDIAAGRVSVAALIRGAPSGDYFAHVQCRRLMFLVMRHRKARQAHEDEVAQLVRDAGHVIDQAKVARTLARKKVKGRFSELIQARYEGLASGATLLSGATFEQNVAQYQALLGHVEQLWESACELYHSRRYPLATFVAILVIEETGKLSNLGTELILVGDQDLTSSKTVIERRHRRKHFLGVMSGALINARLDRVLGVDTVRRLLHEAESDGMEKLRQSCLYVDAEDGRTSLPEERIGKRRARELVVLAGELMAEILGCFPWEFRRMIEKAITFERSVGFPEKRIALAPQRTESGAATEMGGA